MVQMLEAVTAELVPHRIQSISYATMRRSARICEHTHRDTYSRSQTHTHTHALAAGRTIGRFTIFENRMRVCARERAVLRRSCEGFGAQLTFAQIEMENVSRKCCGIV